MTPRNFPPMRELLHRLGIRPDKHKAQHFLHRQERCAEIADAAALTKRHTVVEVGAGLGNLSVELAARAGRTLSVEMDTEFADWHHTLEALHPGLHFVHADFLEIDLDDLLADALRERAPLAAAGNLPYQITSGILFKFVDAPMTFDSITVMIQTEVAERIAAGTGTRDAGALTYKIAMRYRSEVVLHLPPGEFLPPPKVNSAVLRLTPLPAPLFRDTAHRTRVYRTLDGVFRYRRKTLLNGLQEGALVSDKETAARVLAAANIDARRRPETLSLEEFLALEAALP